MSPPEWGWSGPAHHINLPEAPETLCNTSGFAGFEGRSAFQPGTYQARVFPQYVDSLRADGIRDWDTRLLRRCSLYERLSLTVSTDFLNLTNHTQFGAPSLSVTSSSFGQLTSQVNSPRIIQFNTRIEF